MTRAWWAFLRLIRWPWFADEPAAAPGDLPPVMRVARLAALVAVAAIVAATTSVALVESYRGLYLWAVHHSADYAQVWPLMVDTFVIVGELALFVAMCDRWWAARRSWAWTVTVGGLAVSVAGNVGHVWADGVGARLTNAVPPFAAFVSLTIGLQLLKRVLAADGRRSVPQADTVRPRGDVDTRELVGVLSSVGITDTGMLAAIVDRDPRTVRRYRAEANGAGRTDTSAAADTTGPRRAAKRRHAAGRQPRLVRVPPVADEPGPA